MQRPPFYWYYARVKELTNKKGITDPRKLAAWEWHHKLTRTEKERILKRERAMQKKHGKKKSLIRGTKKLTKKTGPKKRSVSLSPYYVGGPIMAKKHHGKKGGYKVTHHVAHMHGDFGMDGFAKQTMNFLGTLALVLFGAAGSSFIANKIPAGMPGSKHLKALLPAGMGISGHLATPRQFKNISFPIMCGAMAVTGVTGVKTYLPGVPLLAGDANALQVPQYTMGTDAQGRLIDTRDGSLLLDEQGRTLKGDGTPHEENMDGPGDMLGDSVPGDMLGDVSQFGDEEVSLVGETAEDFA